MSAVVASAPVSALLESLRVFPANVQATLVNARVDWRWRPAIDAWSLTEVVCHLRDVEVEVHQPRFRAVLAREHAFISGVDADEWTRPRDYQAQDGPAALARFLQARADTVDLLQGLPSASWERQGRHAFFGPTTLQELLAIVVRHDAAHWDQLYELVVLNPSDPSV